MYVEIISNSKVDFPLSSSEHSFSWVKRNGLRFKPKSEVLTADNIKRYSQTVIQVYVGENMYDFYSSFSKINHGNPFFNTNQPETERYWIAITATSVVGFLIELIDREVLRKGGSRAIRDWLKDVERVGNPLMKQFSEKKKFEFSKYDAPTKANMAEIAQHKRSS